MIPSSTPTSAVSRRVLIVDDQVDGARMLEILLSTWGHEAQTALNGEDAFRLAQEFLPAFLLIDIVMPSMNGLELARMLKREQWGQSLTLIAITGWSSEASRQAATDAGFDHFLIKPIGASELRAILAMTGE